MNDRSQPSGATLVERLRDHALFNKQERCAMFTEAANRIAELEAELASCRDKAAKHDQCSAKVDCLSRTGAEPQPDWNYSSQPGKLGGPSTKD